MDQKAYLTINTNLRIPLSFRCPEPEEIIAPFAESGFEGIEFP